MTLKLFNSLTRKKETFIPIEESKVRFYICGPTVYGYIHIGNARPFIVFDVLRSFFEYLKYDVTYVLNLTDIDDRIINRANQEGVDASEIATKYARAFFEDIRALGVRPADIHPKATENVDTIIALIKNLLDKGFAYKAGNDVFFNVAKFDTYGKLSGKKLEDLRAGARVAVNESKNNPLDFVLWKSRKPGEPAWDSPWGSGRPGWHIECSAMSMKHLGHTFDIHAGGHDLIFPHHENEVAQSECATGEPFVRYWLHNGLLHIDGEKMSKSIGNILTVREVLKKFSGSVLRMFFLQKHYRSPIDLTEAGLQAAERASSRLKIFYDKLCALLDKNTLTDLKLSVLPEPFASLKAGLISAMADDLNTPTALSNLFEMVREANKLLSKEEHSVEELATLTLVRHEIEETDVFLGLISRDQTDLSSGLVSELVTFLIEIRQELRAKREWALADKIRDGLNERGIILEDGGKGTEWRLH